MTKQKQQLYLTIISFLLFLSIILIFISSILKFYFKNIDLNYLSIIFLILSCFTIIFIFLLVFYPKIKQLIKWLRKVLIFENIVNSFAIGFALVIIIYGSILFLNISSKFNNDLGSNALTILALVGEIFLILAYIYLVKKIWIALFHKKLIDNLPFSPTALFLLSLIIGLLLFSFIMSNSTINLTQYKMLISSLLTVNVIITALIAFVFDEEKSNDKKFKRISYLLILIFVISLLFLFKAAFTSPLGFRTYYPIMNSITGNTVANFRTFNLTVQNSNEIRRIEILTNNANMPITNSSYINSIIFNPMPFSCSGNTNYTLQNGSKSNKSCNNSNSEKIAWSFNFTIFIVIYNIILFAFLIWLKIDETIK